MNVSFTNSHESIASAKRADTDWAALTTEQRIRSIEVDGYVVIPDLLSAFQLDAIRGELSRLPTTAVDYSEHQRGSRPRSRSSRHVATRNSTVLPKRQHPSDRIRHSESSRQHVPPCARNQPATLGVSPSGSPQSCDLCSLDTHVRGFSRKTPSWPTTE